MSQRIPVIVIIALPHSGSHLLSQLLGAHTQCLSIGELHNYDKLTNRSSGGGGNVISSYAEDPIFAQLDRLPVERWHSTILERAQERYPAVTTLVDNSKRVAWCASLMTNSRLDVHPVHLIRDPRALLRYWMLSYDSPKKIRRQRVRHSRMKPLQAPALMSCSPRELYLRKWLIRNEQASALLARYDKSDNVVTYHDLATRPETTLECLMPRLGLEYEPSQLRYGDASHHGTVKRDYQQATEASAIQLDVRWQDFLRTEDLEAVSSDRRIRKYLSKLDLTFAERGLTAGG
jgi:hypothetical protein